MLGIVITVQGLLVGFGIGCAIVLIVDIARFLRRDRRVKNLRADVDEAVRAKLKLPLPKSDYIERVSKATLANQVDVSAIAAEQLEDRAKPGAFFTLCPFCGFMSRGATQRTMLSDLVLHCKQVHHAEWAAPAVLGVNETFAELTADSRKAIEEGE